MTFCDCKDAGSRNVARGLGRLTGFVLAAAMTVTPVAAQAPTPLATLLDCRAITDEAKRLACFDRSATMLAAAIADRDVVVTDRVQRAALAKQDFGRSAASANEGRSEGRAMERPALPAKIDAMIARAGRLPTGRWLIVLDNGARWQQADDRILARDPRAGMKITVMRAALGSYLGRIDGQVAIRLRRVD